MTSTTNIFSLLIFGMALMFSSCASNQTSEKTADNQENAEEKAKQAFVELKASVANLDGYDKEIKRRIKFLEEVKYGQKQVPQLQSQYYTLKGHNQIIKSSLTALETGQNPELFSQIHHMAIDQNGDYHKAIEDSIIIHQQRWDTLMYHTDEILLSRIDSLQK